MPPRAHARVAVVIGTLAPLLCVVPARAIRVHATRACAPSACVLARSARRRAPTMLGGPAPPSIVAELEELAARGDVRGALSLLKREPPSDAALPDGIDGTATVWDPVLRRNATVSVSRSAEADWRRATWATRIYGALADAGALRAFGSRREPESWPLQSSLRTAVLDDTALRRHIGYSRARFRPATPPLSRRLTLALAGAFAMASVGGFAQAEVAVRRSRARMRDPLRDVSPRAVPAPNAARVWRDASGQLGRTLEVGAAAGGIGAGTTAALGVIDTVVLGGCASEAARRVLDRERAPRVAAHEAGHVLAAVLLGCPVEAVAVSPRDALAQRAVLGGRPGARFVDPVLGAQLAAGAVGRDALERYCIVAMAGIAAEAEVCGRAEGGAADERALRTLLTAAGYAEGDVRSAAVWGAANAVLLVREHRDGAFARLWKELLADGADVASAVLAIEGGGHPAQPRRTSSVD